MNRKIASAIDKINELNAKFGLKIALVLLVLWSGGRGYEIFSGYTFFQPPIAFWLILVTWVILGLNFISRLVRLIKEIITKKSPGIFFGWIITGMVIGSFLWFFNGYRIAIIGLTSSVTGLSASMAQAVFLLFKFTPAIPILPFNYLASLFSDMNIPSSVLVQYAWPKEFLAYYALISLVLGIVFFFIRSGSGFLIFLHFIAALVGTVCLTEIAVAVTQLLPEGSIFGVITEFVRRNLPLRMTHHNQILFHLAVNLMVVLQVIILNSILVHSTKKRYENLNSNALPPGAVKILLWTYVLMPVLADLASRFLLVSKTVM